MPPADCRRSEESAGEGDALELVASAENSTLDWRAQFGYIEDIRDGRGYTGGIVGFTSGTGDMLEVVRLYTRLRPETRLRASRLPYGPSMGRRPTGALGAGMSPPGGRPPATDSSNTHKRSSATGCTSTPRSHWPVATA